MSAMRKCFVVIRMLPLGLLLASISWARASEVTARVEVVPVAKQTSKQPILAPNVVVWLTPVLPQAAYPPPPTKHFRMTQKDKQFTPHLLVVPTGSSVEFPNQDPFFHNVFSLFDGKRFDLGLYEAGSKRSVQFNREGVSYIFCNIHPEMSAVVIALSTPYYGVADANGIVLMHEVPPADYEMKVWAQRGDPAELPSLSRRVHVDAGTTSLGLIRIRETAESTAHKNKFGEDYSPEKSTLYQP